MDFDRLPAPRFGGGCLGRAPHGPPCIRERDQALELLLDGEAVLAVEPLPRRPDLLVALAGVPLAAQVFQLFVNVHRAITLG